MPDSDQASEADWSLPGIILTLKKLESHPGGLVVGNYKVASNSIVFSA